MKIFCSYHLVKKCEYSMFLKTFFLHDSVAGLTKFLLKKIKHTNFNNLKSNSIFRKKKLIKHNLISLQFSLKKKIVPENLVSLHTFYEYL